jgi:hypothetical protein
VKYLYSSLLVIHVVTAILGVGSIASVVIVAVAGRKAGHASTQISAQISASIAPLLRYFAYSLAAMLVSGILLDLAAHGAFHEFWWFRGSVLLLLATGALHGWARRTVAPQRLEQIAIGMCALVAMITMLMEVKPF